MTEATYLPPTPPPSYLQYDRRFYAGSWYYRKNETAPWMICKTDEDHSARIVQMLAPSFADHALSVAIYFGFIGLGLLIALGVIVVALGIADFG